MTGAAYLPASHNNDHEHDCAVCSGVASSSQEASERVYAYGGVSEGESGMNPALLAAALMARVLAPYGEGGFCEGMPGLGLDTGENSELVAARLDEGNNALFIGSEQNIQLAQSNNYSIDDSISIPVPAEGNENDIVFGLKIESNGAGSLSVNQGENALAFDFYSGSFRSSQALFAFVVDSARNLIIEFIDAYLPALRYLWEIIEPIVNNVIDWVIGKLRGSEIFNNPTLISPAPNAYQRPNFPLPLGRSILSTSFGKIDP